MKILSYIGFWCLAVVLMVSVYLIIKRPKTKNKFVAIAVLVASIMALVCLFVFPLDGLFVTFKKPQEAIPYFEDEFKNIDAISTVYGDDSCMLYSSSQEAPRFLKDTERGWKIAKADFQMFSENMGNCGITVYHVKNTQEYYVKVVDFSKSIDFLSDNNNTNFAIYEEENLNQYIGYIKQIDSDYSITIDGKTFNLR